MHELARIQAAGVPRLDRVGPAQANLGGLWAGTVSTPGANGRPVTEQAFAMFLPDGTFRMVSTSLSQVSGTGTYFKNANDGAAVGNVTLKGTASGALMRVTTPGAVQATFTGKLGNVPANLADFQGANGSNPQNNTLGAYLGMTLKADGTFTAADLGGGQYAGKLTQVVPPGSAAPSTFNGFQATLTYPPGSGSPETYQGLAILLPAGSTPALIQMALDDGTSQAVVGLEKTN